MKMIVHNRLDFNCELNEYREINAAFARDAVDWSFTVGERVFDDEKRSLSFNTWEDGDIISDGSLVKLTLMFPRVIFSYTAWPDGQPEPESASQVWCAGQNVTELTPVMRNSVRDRAYIEYCKRFLTGDTRSGEGYAHKAIIMDNEERTAASWGENRFGECEVYYWDSLKSLGCGDFHTVAARSDGRTVATGSNANGQCDVEAFRNADTISCGRYHTAALKKIGAVLLASTDERFTQCATWRGIVALRSVGDTIIGIKRDGNVLIDGDQMCPCTRDDIKAMFPDMKLTFPPGFKSLATKISAEDKRKERALENAGVKKRRKAPASAVELEENGRISDKNKKPRPVKLAEPAYTFTFSYREELEKLESEFCGEELVLPYFCYDAAKYLDKNGVPPVGDNCKRVDEETVRRQIKEFFMVCRLCTNKNYLAVIAENAAKSANGKLIKNRAQRITTFRLTHGEDFYELCARNVDPETIDISVAPVECTLKNCRGITNQPDSRAVLEENCSVKLD